MKEITAMSMAELREALKTAQAVAKAAQAVIKSHDVKTANGLTLRVSAKGGVSVYGLSRFPVTMYTSQLEKFFNAEAEILAFVEANKDKLASKPTKDEEEEEVTA